MNYYDKIANGYDELHKEEQLRKLEIIKKHIAPKPDDRLLDVGCGTGISSGFDCNVVGIDPSMELLKQNPRIKIQGIAESLPFKSSSFDFVVAVSSIHHTKDIKKSLEEIKRVAKESIVFSLFKRSEKFQEIKEEIEKTFKVKEVIDEEKDLIYIIS